MLFKGYIGWQIGPKWTEIEKNRDISEHLEPENAIKHKIIILLHRKNGYTGPQIEPTRMKIVQNRGISEMI